MTSGFLVALPLVSLAGWLAMFGLKHRSLFAGDIAGLVYHLALVPLVQHLPGGPEVKFAGYLWLFLDALVDMVSINLQAEKRNSPVISCGFFVNQPHHGHCSGISGSAAFRRSKGRS